MRKLIRNAAAAAALVLAAAPAAAAPFTLPLPDGWRSETIPFPLSFAPSLPYTGVEELRFAPGMFVQGAEDFWSYVFCWWVPEGTPLDSKLLEADLATYFAGLTATVERAEHFTAENPSYAIELAPVRTGLGLPRRWTGTAAVFDAFASRAQIALRVVVEAEACPDEGMTAVLFMVSPQPEGHAIWKRLGQVRSGFSCLASD